MDEATAPQALEPSAVPSVSGTRFGLIVGHSLADGALADPTAIRIVDTDFGPVRLFDTEDDADPVVLYRHYAVPERFLPAHRVDHHRNIAALCAAGCDRVLALGSVGSLRAWPVGTIVAPYDFFAPQVSPSYFTDARGHSVPGFDDPWRDEVMAAWRELAAPITEGGVYAQTTGPRFETPAEVRMLSQFADIVGMTIASECILAKEAGLAYAAVCVIDNIANGLADSILTVDEFHAGVARNRDGLLADVRAVSERLAATPRPQWHPEPKPQPQP